MCQELKDLLKPPFTVAGISSNGLCIRDNVYPRRNILIVREGGNSVADFITAALNEKWERDFNEPLRWKKSGFEFVCPKCDNHYFNPTSFCPHCGQKLLPPKDNVS